MWSRKPRKPRNIFEQYNKGKNPMMIWRGKMIETKVLLSTTNIQLKTLYTKKLFFL